MGRALIGLEPPTAGRVLFHGQDLRNFTGEQWQRFRRSVQMIFQDPLGSLNPRLTAGKIYRYTVHCARMRDPLRVRTEWTVFRKLDVDAMRAAARDA